MNDLAPQASYEGQTNVADILFGVPSREIGFRHSRNPERVITYAATLALKHYNEEWVTTNARMLAKNVKYANNEFHMPKIWERSPML